jgi:hypothetical protein
MLLFLYQYKGATQQKKNRITAAGNRKIIIKCKDLQLKFVILTTYCYLRRP